MPDDLADAIATAATEPAKASGDAGSYDARTIDEMIKADQYAKAAAAQAAGVSPWATVFGARFVPPGSV